MPIYEYKCLDCDNKFECFTNKICSGAQFPISESDIKCLKCESTRIKRVMSLITRTPNKWKV